MMTVKLEILDNVRFEAAELRGRRRRLDDPLRSSARLMEFVEEAFNQAFRAEMNLGVSGFTQADKEEVLLLSEELAETPVVEDLLRLYVDVCNMWPDVLNQAYGGTAGDFLEFRTELVPSVLEALEGLADARQEKDLHDEVVETRKDYADAIGAALDAIGT